MICIEYFVVYYMYSSNYNNLHKIWLLFFYIFYDSLFLILSFSTLKLFFFLHFFIFHSRFDIFATFALCIFSYFHCLVFSWICSVEFLRNLYYYYYFIFYSLLFWNGLFFCIYSYGFNVVCIYISINATLFDSD